jgi:serine/threonine protein kinase
MDQKTDEALKGTAKYQKLEKLGEGVYGVVYKAKCKQTGQIVALKKVKLDREDEGVPSTSIREISILQELKHPHVVNLIEACLEEERLTLVFEYVDLDLYAYMRRLTKTGRQNLLTPQHVKSYMYQLLAGLSFCHRNSVLHRDLKPQNILINKEGVIKIADFGLARAYAVPTPPYTHEVVTLWYRSPEILLGGKVYSTPVDTWSMGCIMAELATFSPLFAGDSEIHQIFSIFRVLGTPNENMWPGVSAYPDFKTTFPQWKARPMQEAKPKLSVLGPLGLDLLSKMLRYNPAERISAKEALKHPYFADLDKNHIQPVKMDF